MSMSSGDAADEVVRMMLSGAELTLRLTASATKNLLAITIALAKSHKQLYGRTNMKKMLRETRDIPGYSPWKRSSSGHLRSRQKNIACFMRPSGTKGRTGKPDRRGAVRHGVGPGKFGL